MKALTISCTLKASPAESNTEALASVVIDEMTRLGVEHDMVRAVDHSILPGVTCPGAGARLVVEPFV